MRAVVSHESRIVFVPAPRYTGIARSTYLRWFVWSMWMWDTHTAENSGGV